MNSNNVWLTDVGLHQVFKFTASGELLLTLGTARESGNDSSHFNLPTDVAVLPGGDFYISDGYANTRVLKFSAAGEFLFQWGAPGSGPGQFRLPHGIALDQVGRVYVADRSDSRIQVFDEKPSSCDPVRLPSAKTPGPTLSTAVTNRAAAPGSFPRSSVVPRGCDRGGVRPLWQLRRSVPARA